MATDGRPLVLGALLVIAAGVRMRGSRGAVRRGRDARPVAPARVDAHIKTDDGAYEATFDAIPWLRQAELDEIVTLEGAGFRGDYSADDVAWWAADPQGGNDPDVAHVLHRVQKDSLPFEVWVDGEQATAWLDAERPGWSEWSDEGEV
jgi:hypothetical protein